MRALFAISRSMEVSIPTPSSSGLDPVSSLVDDAGGAGCWLAVGGGAISVAVWDMVVEWERPGRHIRANRKWHFGLNYPQTVRQ